MSGRRHQKRIEVETRLLPSLRAVGGRSGRWFIDVFTGWDFWRDGRRMVRRMWRRDKEGNRYEEKITDPETDKVIHECHESLREHQAHGSAKPKLPS